jgi:hypothetical protein
MVREELNKLHWSAGSPKSKSPSEGRASEVSCQHGKTSSDKYINGNFLTLRSRCVECGKIVSEENILLGTEHLRCPVDMRLERCILSCPVADGSASIFQAPCDPVRRIMMSEGIIPSMIPFKP